MSGFIRLVYGNEAATNSVDIWTSISIPSMSDLAAITTPPLASFSWSFMAANLKFGEVDLFV